MAKEWHQSATVHSGGRVEVIVPELKTGEEVEVVVRRNGASSSVAVDLPCFGSARGRVVMREDFDAPLDDLRDYM